MGVLEREGLRQEVVREIRALQREGFVQGGGREEEEKRCRPGRGGEEGEREEGEKEGEAQDASRTQDSSRTKKEGRQGYDVLGGVSSAARWTRHCRKESL